MYEMAPKRVKSSDPLSELTSDSLPAKAILQKLNNMGYITIDSQPGFLSKKHEDKILADPGLYARCMELVPADKAFKAAVDAKYVSLGGTFVKAPPEPTERQRAYICGWMRSDIADAVVVEMNKVDGMVAMTSARDSIPVTWQRSNNIRPDAKMYNIGGALYGRMPFTTAIPAKLLEEPRPSNMNIPRSHTYFVAFDTVSGRLAYKKQGLFHVLKGCIQMKGAKRPLRKPA
jgi:hypothetical protein